MKPWRTILGSQADKPLSMPSSFASPFADCSVSGRQFSCDGRTFLRSFGWATRGADLARLPLLTVGPCFERMAGFGRKGER